MKQVAGPDPLDCQTHLAIDPLLQTFGMHQLARPSALTWSNQRVFCSALLLQTNLARALKLLLSHHMRCSVELQVGSLSEEKLDGVHMALRFPWHPQIGEAVLSHALQNDVFCSS